MRSKRYHVNITNRVIYDFYSNSCKITVRNMLLNNICSLFTYNITIRNMLLNIFLLCTTIVIKAQFLKLYYYILSLIWLLHKSKRVFLMFTFFILLIFTSKAEKRFVILNNILNYNVKSCPWLMLTSFRHCQQPQQ